MQSVARLCRYEKGRGGKMFVAIRPAVSETGQARILPGSASTLLFWRKLEDEFGIKLNRKGVALSLAHPGSDGLGRVSDLVECVYHDALVHWSASSGFGDGLQPPGGTDAGATINALTIAAAGLMERSGYRRWKAHPITPRPYETDSQVLDRIVRSILNWEACAFAAKDLDEKQLTSHFQQRQIAKADGQMRRAVSSAWKKFDEWYR